MSSLAGQFAGILLVFVPADNVDACISELHGLESEGIRIITHVSDDQSETGQTHEYELKLIGNDRPGIVHEITELLASHKVNVNNFETLVESASMGGGELFKAKAQLVVPKTTDIDVLAGELEDIANDLMVDIRFEK
jgi:glycine cleavage system regulatory protein